jgi:hypothetical protein
VVVVEDMPDGFDGVVSAFRRGVASLLLCVIPAQAGIQGRGVVLDQDRFPFSRE